MWSKHLVPWVTHHGRPISCYSKRYSNAYLRSKLQTTILPWPRTKVHIYAALHSKRTEMRDLVLLLTPRPRQNSSADLWTLAIADAWDLDCPPQKLSNRESGGSISYPKSFFPCAALPELLTCWPLSLRHRSPYQDCIYQPLAWWLLGIARFGPAAWAHGLGFYLLAWTASDRPDPRTRPQILRLPVKSAQAL